MIKKLLFLLITATLADDEIEYDELIEEPQEPLPDVRSMLAQLKELEANIEEIGCEAVWEE